MSSIDAITGYPIDFVDPRGYVKIVCAGHPLAGSRDRAPRHRVVLHDHLGGRPWMPCYWCGFVLPWKSTLAASQYRTINVDHLNGVPGDDRPENLVASCWWCNANRGWGEALEPDLFKKFCRWMADVPPWDRPNLPAIVSDIRGYDVMGAYRASREEAA